MYPKYESYKVVTSIFRIVYDVIEELGYFKPEVMDEKLYKSFAWQVVGAIDLYMSKNLSSPEDVGMVDVSLFENMHSDDLQVIKFEYEEFIEIFMNVLAVTEEQKKMNFNMILWYFYHTLKTDDKFLKHVANFKLLMVDESQDNDTIQFDILELLVTNTETGALVLIYDKAQSIYQFRYATPEGLEPFEKGKIVEAVNLELLYNYRSLPELVKATNYFRTALGLSTSIPARESKGTTPIEVHTAFSNILEANKIIELIESQLSLGYQYKDIAVLTRTNKVLKEIVETSLINKGLPYKLLNDSTGDKLLDRTLTDFLYNSLLHLLGEGGDTNIYNMVKILLPEVEEDVLIKAFKEEGELTGRTHNIIVWVRDLMAHLGDSENDMNKISTILYFIYSSLKDLYEETGIESIRSLIQDGVVVINSIINLVVNILEHRKVKLGLSEIIEETLKVLSDYDKGFTEDVINIGSIHASKGLEFPIVIVAGFMHGRQPTDKLDDFIQKSYVQMTRAMEKLLLVKSVNFYPIGDEDKVVEDLEPREGKMLEIVEEFTNFSLNSGYGKARGFKI